MKEEKKNNKKIKEEEIKEEKEVKKENIKGEEKKQGEHFKEPDLPTLFVWFISMLSGKAWQYLGLIMDPESKKINKDLKKAKISIDTINFLFEKIKDDLNKEDYKRIDSLIANLKMNYVDKLKESQK
jgi:hypothetical protein